jgi:hypothetical protein
MRGDDRFRPVLRVGFGRLAKGNGLETSCILRIAGPGSRPGRGRRRAILKNALTRQQRVRQRVLVKFALLVQFDVGPSCRVTPNECRSCAVGLVTAARIVRLGGHPKCTTCGRLKMYQGSVAT